MDSIEVSTGVYLPPEEVYAFLLDFPRYARYSEHLTEVRAFGSGDPGTEYELVFSWWKLSYTVRSKVTAVEPPERIDWRLVRGVDAAGAWLIEPIDEGSVDDEPTRNELDDEPTDDEPATRVTFLVSYDPDSADEGRLDLPRFVPLSWVVEKAKPLVAEEAERIVERVVADLEGERRDVELSIETRRG